MDPVLLQTAIDATQATHDVVTPFFEADYPWGDNAADEGAVGVLAWLVNRAIQAWENVELDKAMWGGDDD